jgi:predicted O-methyltransferase YrrM
MRWEQDLIKDIRTHSGYDDSDMDPERRITRDYPLIEAGVPEEFSACNKTALMKHFLKIKDQAKSILEIGVCRNGESSSTYCFLNNKNDETAYVGIDLVDKSFLNNEDKRIYTICGNSSNVDRNIETIKSWGIEQLDFILIDGWHSINQVLTDWEYTKILSSGGIVAFHDVNEHPGPYYFIRNLNLDVWNIDLCCHDDWGIGFAWKK